MYRDYFADLAFSTQYLSRANPLPPPRQSPADTPPIPCPLLQVPVSRYLFHESSTRVTVSIPRDQYPCHGVYIRWICSTPSLLTCMHHLMSNHFRCVKGSQVREEGECIHMPSSGAAPPFESEAYIVSSKQSAVRSKLKVVRPWRPMLGRWVGSG